MWQEYIQPASLNDALAILKGNSGAVRILSGGTDLILELERGQRKGVATIVDTSRLGGLDRIVLDEEGVLHIGPSVTHAACLASKLIREYAWPLAQACGEVGSPQIRNRGTIAGNLVTASPANDTIAPLMALGAQVTLKSTQGERVVPLDSFYTGVRKCVLQPDEILVDIAFPILSSSHRGVFVKYALRSAQAISLINIAVVLKLNGERVDQAAITLGAVAPTIIHAKEAEAFLVGKVLSADVIEQAAVLVEAAVSPISDVRSSADYRQYMARVLALRGLKSLREPQGAQSSRMPVLLWGKESALVRSSSECFRHDDATPIVTRINGKTYTFEHGQHKTLLRLLREDAQLVGSKEGCAEGECGACTVYLDGRAVMACMVPAPRAHHAEIVTIEGLAQGETLHPVQKAFVEKGAVQCGYCTPGFVMSAAKLLEEKPHPTEDEIKIAITGNLCRCTGYYKIVQAIELAAQEG